MSEAKQIGSELVALCKEGKNIEAVEKFYADNIVSVESVETPGFPREATGKDTIIGKNQWWAENHEVHSNSIDGPYPHGDDRFAVRYDFDVTNKPSGQRIKMTEVAVYQVQDGKIVREEFFYDSGQ